MCIHWTNVIVGEIIWQQAAKESAGVGDGEHVGCELFGHVADSERVQFDVAEGDVDSHVAKEHTNHK